MPVKLIWATPNADQLVGYMARVSNPTAKLEDDASRLIAYLVRHEHWSPFEMVNACMEINSTREVIRQILRHRSFHFQEFSGRYAEYTDGPVISEARLQDTKNRQNSIDTDDRDLNGWWMQVQLKVWDFCYVVYKEALKRGIAKELARKVLPEGLVPSKVYMNGTIRDWIHYLRVRTGQGTQKEHRVVAQELLQIFEEHCPVILHGVQQGGIVYDPA